MAGTREKGHRWRRAPAILAMLLAAAELLTPAGPAGAAREPAAKAVETTRVVSTAGTPAPGTTAAVKRAPERTAAVVSEKEEAFGPIPESEAVEDTYFEDAVFLGDSRTEGFSLYSGLETGTCLYGVGATVESVFSKKDWAASGEKVPLLDALAETECGKVYLMLGVNELGWSKKETFYNQYAKVIDRIREDLPEAKIVLQTILPVSARQDARGSYVNNERIAVYNEVIRSLAEEKDCFLADVAEALTGEDGCLPADLNFDGVHLNPAGCKIWLNYLRTHSV